MLQIPRIEPVHTENTAIDCISINNNSQEF